MRQPHLGQNLLVQDYHFKWRILEKMRKDGDLLEYIRSMSLHNTLRKGGEVISQQILHAKCK